MKKKRNLSILIRKNLPKELIDLTKKAATLNARKNQPLYLVGGAVRDLLLGMPNLDLDLVVEGDAINLAKELAQITGGKFTSHPMFNTAKISLHKINVDIAMARTETYTKPGALPTVKPGTLKTDLFRRDFTINAMAINLTPDKYGELVDLYGGLDDLQNKVIRVLHEKSFTDDATRIWRAIRYEQRLGFKIEPVTLKLLKRDTALLKTVGGYRLRRELELVLREKEPEKIIQRADKLDVLKQLHPALKFDKWLEAEFKKAYKAVSASPEAYLKILLFQMTEDEFKEFVSYLRFPKQIAEKIKVTPRK